MSSHNEQIKPTEFAVTGKSPPGTHSPATDSSNHLTQRWIIPLLVLIVIAIFVVVWLPGRINQQPTLAPPTASETVTTPVPATGIKSERPGEETSPWSDAQLAKMRKEAQAVLAELLDAQFELEEIGVKQWAAEDFAKAAEIAAEADSLYRERQFMEAQASYQQGLDALQTLLNMAPQVLADALVRARESIDGGAEEIALAALLMAATIEPDNEELAGLRQRAAVMQQLSSLLAQADEAENSGNLEQTQGLLQQAVALDAKSAEARSGLARVSKAYTTQRFNNAMSNGYVALNEGQFERARSALRKAAKLIPGSAVVASALQDVASAETAQRLSDLQQKGLNYEAQEQWAEALAAFEQALQIDAGLLFAQDGLKRSRVRARLDQQLSSVIDQPERLSDKKVADATAQLLRNAASINPRGPLLQQQLEQLEAVLEKANTLIAVTLRSDMETEVTVRKVARLGRFEQHQLSLRPGTYIAVGTRDGYRDVRRTFSINHDSKPPTVVITCTEQI